MEPLSFGIKIKTLDNALHELEVFSEMTITNLKILIEEVNFNTNDCLKNFKLFRK